MSSDPRDLTTLPDLRYVRELARVFKQYELGEIEIESGDQRILLRRGDLGQPVMVTAAPTAVAPASASAPVAAPAPVGAAAEAPVEGTYITSPFVGTFYRSPSPDKSSFVEVGSTVGVGQTLCIVEAMKLFNELEAEFPCVIEAVLLENAQPVEFGTRLFKVRKL